MKTAKLMASLLIGLCSLPAAAQTDFRHITFDEALQAAKKEKKHVFIDFYTDWCGPCKRMSREVFPQKSVGDFMNARFVCLKLNAEKEGVELAKKYGVKAYPTYYVIDAQGKQLMTASGSMPPDDFIAKIESGLNPGHSPERMKQLYAEGKRTPDLINNYALYLMEQRKEAEGFRQEATQRRQRLPLHTLHSQSRQRPCPLHGGKSRPLRQEGAGGYIHTHTESVSQRSHYLLLGLSDARE